MNLRAGRRDAARRAAETFRRENAAWHKKVEESLGDLDALAEPATEEWIERAQAEQDEYEALVASGEIAAAASSVSAGAGQVPADTIEKALNEGHTLLSAFAGAADFDEFSSPAVRQRIRETRDLLAAALAAGAGQVPADTIVCDSLASALMWLDPVALAEDEDVALNQAREAIRAARAAVRTPEEQT